MFKRKQKPQLNQKKPEKPQYQVSMYYTTWVENNKIQGQLIIKVTKPRTYSPTPPGLTYKPAYGPAIKYLEKTFKGTLEQSLTQADKWAKDLQTLNGINQTQHRIVMLNDFTLPSEIWEERKNELKN